MKNITIVFCTLLFSCNLLNGQTYGEYMQMQKEIFGAQKSFEITVDQVSYKEGIQIDNLSFQTKIFSRDQELFWEMPGLKVLQNNRAYIMIRELEDLILYSPISASFNLEENRNEGMARWQETLETYVDKAISIEKTESNSHYYFDIQMDDPTINHAQVSFSKQNNLMTGMKMMQRIDEENIIRVEYSFAYDFNAEVPDYFDEKKYVSYLGEHPVGIGKYAGFEVLYQPIE